MEGEYLSLTPNIGGAVAFAAAYFIVGFPLKLIGGALFRQPWSQKLLFYTIVPFYSPRSWDRAPLEPQVISPSPVGLRYSGFSSASAYMPSIGTWWIATPRPHLFEPTWHSPAFTSSPKRWAQYFACCF